MGSFVAVIEFEGVDVGEGIVVGFEAEVGCFASVDGWVELDCTGGASDLTGFVVTDEEGELAPVALSAEQFDTLFEAVEAQTFEVAEAAREAGEGCDGCQRDVTVFVGC
jgi:hypothetical protein